MGKVLQDGQIIKAVDIDQEVVGRSQIEYWCQPREARQNVIIKHAIVVGHHSRGNGDIG